MSDNKESETGSGFQVFDPGLLFFILRKSLLWMLLLLLFFMAGAYLYLHYTPPVFESSSILQIASDNQANRLLNVDDIYEDKDISKDIEFLRSEEFFKRVLTRLPFDVSYFVKGQILTNERFKNSAYEVWHDLIDPTLQDIAIHIRITTDSAGEISYRLGNEDHTFDFNFLDTLKTPHALFVFRLNSPEIFHQESELIGQNSSFFKINSPQANLQRLKSMYKVELLSASAKTVRISVQDFNAMKASVICNAIAQEYLIYDVERKSESASKILNFIDEQFRDVYEQLKESETLLKDFNQESRITEKQGYASSYISRLEELEKEKAELELQISLLEELKRNIDMEKTGVDIYALLPVLAGSEFESNMQNQIRELQNLVMRRNGLLSTATKDNPNIIIYDQQIEVQKNLILQSLNTLHTRMNTILKSTRSKIDQIEQNFLDLPSTEIEYARLSRVFNSNEKYYTMLLEKKTEFSISKAGYVADNRILQAAQPAQWPISPSRSIIYGLSLMLSILAMVSLVGLRYFLHNDVSIPEIARLIHPEISILGAIPKYSQIIPQSQLIVDKRPKSFMAESFRSVRSNLEFFEAKNSKRVIAITSTISGEGKTFVAINLGGILALGEKKVIILDLDMRRPRIHQGFNSSNDVGMSTYLSGRGTLEGIIRKSELENLHFITAGPVPPNPSELIINGRLNKAIEDLKALYDIVIIDNPPVGLVTDGIACLRLADYPIYIFRSEYSKKAFLANVNHLFRENRIKNLSLIVNGLNLDRAKYGNYGTKYSGGYGYGYGYGGYGYGGYGYGYTSGSGYYEDPEPDSKGLGFLRKRNSEKQGENQ